jgi:ADP-ribose 1''-phosphate phosphatase
MIAYKKGSLFEAEKGVTLLHACNCQGRWGSGIAAEFARRFPDACKIYNRHCLNNPNLIGKSLVIEDKGYKIACLFTSNNYGAKVDRPEQILKATKNSLDHMFMKNPSLLNIHSPKINSGLFKTPWEDTEKLILDSLERNPSVEWTVWEF